MQYKRLAFAAAASLGLACCVQPAPEPTPPPPTPTPTPPPPPTVTQPAFDNWMDAPATAGDWYFRSTASSSQASFGETQSEARFALYCNRAARTVTLMRAGAADGAVTMRVRTETGDLTLSADPAGRELPAISATLPASDPLLAAMAFSKGRFAVATPGLPTLYIPSWPEVTRVIEDCR